MTAHNKDFVGSPYIAGAATRAGLTIGSHLVGSCFEFSQRMPRTQREAGIEFMEWEERAEPLRPLWADLASGAGFAMFVAFCLVVLPSILTAAHHVN